MKLKAELKSNLEVPEAYRTLVGQVRPFELLVVRAEGNDPWRGLSRGYDASFPANGFSGQQRWL